MVEYSEFGDSYANPLHTLALALFLYALVKGLDLYLPLIQAYYRNFKSTIKSWFNK